MPLFWAEHELRPARPDWAGAWAEFRVASRQNNEQTIGGHGPDRQATGAAQATAGPDGAHGARNGDAPPAHPLVARHPRGGRSAALALAVGTAYYVSRLPDYRRAARPARGRVGHPARRLGRNLRLARPAARRDPRRGRLAAPDQRHHRHRGPPLLLALRRRPAGHRPGAAGQPARRRDGAGRLLAHPAGGQARLLRQHPHARAQDQGDPGGAGARVEVLQERDPVDLPQPRLSRRRRHRLRGGVRALLRQVGGRGEPGRGRDAGRPAARPVALRADQRPRPGAGARQDHRRPDGGAGLPDRRPGAGGPGAPGGAVGRGGGAGGRRLRRLGDVVGPGVPDPQDHRGRPGPDHLRPAHPARGRGRPRGGLRQQAQGRLERPGGDRRDVARRRRARHGRRARLRRRRGPVQPRHPGAAPDRLALQALRLRRRAAGRRQPLRRRARRAAQPLHPRLRRVVAAELHRASTRARSPSPRRWRSRSTPRRSGSPRRPAGRGCGRSRRTSASPRRSPTARRSRSGCPRRRCSR